MTEEPMSLDARVTTNMRKHEDEDGIMAVLEESNPTQLQYNQHFGVCGIRIQLLDYYMYQPYPAT